MPLQSLIEDDLLRLNGAYPGLGDTVVSYVVNGKPRDALVRLSGSGAGKRIEPEGTGTYSQSIAFGRCYVLGTMLASDPGLCARYAEVLTASLSTWYERPAAWSGVPLPLQDYIRSLIKGISYFYSAERMERFTSSFRSDTLLDFARRFEATAADLLVALYNEPESRYSFSKVSKLRQRLDCRTLLMADHAALGLAAARLGEEGRIGLLYDVSSCKLAAEEPGLGFVMDMAGSNLKAVREVAQRIVATLDPALREAEALKRLRQGDATMREAMAGVLVSVGTPTAQASLEAHLPGERAAAVRALIERKMKVDALGLGTANADDATGYVAVGGAWIAIPPLRPLRPHDGTTLGVGDVADLRVTFHAFLARKQAEDAARMAKDPNSVPDAIPKPESLESLIAFLNGDWTDKGWRADYPFRSFVNEGEGKVWMERALSRLSQETGLRFALCADRYLDLLLGGDRFHTVWADVLADYAATPEGDLRQVLRLVGDLGLPVRDDSISVAGPTFLTDTMRQNRYNRSDWLRAFPADFLWPWIAGHLDVPENALRPEQLAGFMDITKVAAVLRHLPATPNRLAAGLLDYAIGSIQAGRADAQMLVAGIPGLDGHLAGMLTDKRHTVRQTVANWLATRGAKLAIPQLEKALSKETAAKPYAAMLSALRQLGGNLEPFVGEAALNRAAAEGIRKADFGPLAWMDLKAMPRLAWASGVPVPIDTQMFWLFQALRLKAPAETGMFAVYLDRCEPSQAKVFSDWVFNSWLDRAEVDAPMRASREDLDPWQGMPKSIDSKGILALGVVADGRNAAHRVHAFLKKNGQQSQHCAALLELLAAKGDEASLQIVLAAATRIKQKSLQKLSADLVSNIAGERGWTPEELADRTVPDCGLDEDGSARLPMGQGRPDCRMKLNDALELVLMNGAGLVVKSLPAADTPEARESKSLWAETKKEVAATAGIQAGRLHAAMIAGRTWALDDWQRDVLGHPVMGALARLLVWQGLGGDDQPVATFRPLAGGGAVGPLGDPVSLGGVLSVRLAHGALLTDADTIAWEAFVKPRRVKAPVAQFSRPAKRLHPEMATQTRIADREGWVTDTFTIRGIAKRLGHDRGEIVDSGVFSTYVRRFESAGYVAVLTFSGNCVPEENLPASPLYVSFQSIGGRGELPLARVPPVLLSEGWNDYYDLAARGRYDPNWLKLMPFM